METSGAREAQENESEVGAGKRGATLKPAKTRVRIAR
jgi:hypothetical protein